MARSSVLTFARSIVRRCTARPAFAALTALALGGAVAGGAMALSPTVDTALVFRGGVNVPMFTATAGEARLAYTVPAGRKFMLTDLVITNDSETTPATVQSVFTGSGASCTLGPARTNFLSIPAASTLHLPFVTGIGFTAGQSICADNGEGAGGNATHWTIRGYLFE